MKCAPAVFAALLLSAPAEAQPSSGLTAEQEYGYFSDARNSCLNAARRNSFREAECHADESGRLYTRLDLAYRAAMNRLPSEAARARLRTEHEAWRQTVGDGCRNSDDQYRGSEHARVLCGQFQVISRIARLERPI